MCDQYIRNKRYDTCTLTFFSTLCANIKATLNMIYHLLLNIRISINENANSTRPETILMYTQSFIRRRYLHIIFTIILFAIFINSIKLKNKNTNEEINNLIKLAENKSFCSERSTRRGFRQYVLINNKIINNLFLLKFSLYKNTWYTYIFFNIYCFFQYI